MNPPQQPSSPGFYKFMAIVFLVLGVVFVWAAIHQHSWFFGAFAVITILNALNCGVKSAAGEVRR